MIDAESESESQTDTEVGSLRSNASLVTVKVYTRHKRTCPRHDRPEWARCNCTKWLYVHRNGKDTRTSAKTRRWEKAEQKARGLRDSLDASKRLQRYLEAKLNARTGQLEVALSDHPKCMVRRSPGKGFLWNENSLRKCIRPLGGASSWPR